MTATDDTRLANILSVAEVGVWSLDLCTGRLDSDRNVAELHAVGEAELRNRGPAAFVDRVHPDDAAMVEAALTRTHDHLELFDPTYRIVRPDGSIRWIANRGRVVLDEKGTPVSIDGVAIDVTERRLAEERLLDATRAARAEAERLSHMKDEFLATLSHELRTPLNAILGWSELLRSDSLPDATRRQAIEIIDRNARVQTRLIEDLLEMSRIISDKVRLDLQPVELADVVAAAVESAEPMAKCKGIRLSKVIEAGVGTINGDAPRLQQVISNLLGNAIKFTPVGGNIRVSLSRTATDIEVVVRDNGSGIAPDFAPFLFDRFAQGEPSHTRRFGGLGLGLSIVKHLVEMHGGCVAAASAGPGQGSTFTVRLPVATGGANDDLDATERIEQIDTRLVEARLLTGVKVLVVDDEPDARELMKRVLETRDAKVVTAASAAVALELVERYRPDIVLSDIGMPGIDGYDFIRQVRALGAKRGGSVPAIAVTAFARAEDRDRAIMAGYQQHLPKPMQVHQLVDAIASSIPCRP